MEGPSPSSKAKQSCDSADAVNDVKNAGNAKKIFSTKLSLPKFIAISKLLTPDQKSLVDSMGFSHLLDLCCESVPRGISIWLAKHFDVKSRTLILPNGSRIVITPLFVHRVLGIPIGGKAVSKRCEDSVKSWICQETKCKGSNPTINELKALFTPQLSGGKFKIIYFELLDVPITREYQHISLLKFWSTDMIKAFETLDAEDDEHSVFGRLPVLFFNINADERFEQNHFLGKHCR
ncbi:uncharacterized protein LOC120672278 [Panicum virgatum]|uniref:uncharacterized protein LOC120672278 n=1 Tax=Panicum virgatum TaxID=38727 RepID=UPI0019D553B3|nr:uncharacterized protein LOC120672278 [Panicum virgatum]